jgi:hypothetical protein
MLWTEINVEKTKVIRISRETSPLQITIHKKQLQNAEYFKYFGSMINYARSIREIKSWIAMQKQHSTARRLFTSKFDLNLRNKLVKRYIWETALYGIETRSLWEVYLKYWKVLKRGAGEGRRSAGPIV